MPFASENNKVSYPVRKTSVALVLLSLFDPPSMVHGVWKVNGSVEDLQ